MFGIKRGFFMGMVIGFGAGFVARDVAKHLGPTLKPLTKEAMKAGMNLMTKLKEQVGYFQETVTDLAAEAKSEVVSEKIKSTLREVKMEESRSV